MRMAHAISPGLSLKKEEYLGNTPRLTRPKMAIEIRNWSFSNFFVKDGATFRSKSLTEAGINMTMAKNSIIAQKEISDVFPTRIFTRTGSVKGTRSEVTTTIINT